MLTSSRFGVFQSKSKILSLHRTYDDGDSPEGSYANNLKTPSSSSLAMAKFPPVKKKSTVVAHLLRTSFARMTSLYGSSCKMRVHETRRENGYKRLTWKATSQTLLATSPINNRFFSERSDVTYIPTSRKATPTKRSSRSRARTKICRDY